MMIISDLEKALTLGAGIMAALSGFITIILGYIIYKDLGIDKVVTDKQVNTVIEFLEELKTIQLHCGAFVNGEIKSWLMGWSISKYLVEREKPKNDEEHWVDYARFLVVFDAENYYDKMNKLRKLKNSIWMPPELLKEFELLSSPAMPSIENNPKYLSCMKIMINERLNLTDTSKIKWGIDFEDEMTFERFYNILFNSCIEIEQWLQRHSKITVKLNV